MRYKDEVKGKMRLGVQAYADALLVIPKTLGEYENDNKSILRICKRKY